MDDNYTAYLRSLYSDSPVAMPQVEDYKPQPGCEDQGDVLAKQVGGSHYRRAHQPWEIIEEWKLNFWAGNVVKYILRYKFKNGVEDLEKAKHYLEYLIKKEKNASITTRD